MNASEVKIGGTYKAALRDKVRRVKILEMILGRDGRVGWKAEDVENGDKTELFIANAKQLSPTPGGAREGTGPKPKRLMPCGWCGVMMSKTGKGGAEAHFEVCPKRPKVKRA
jgi:hypothetical protein